jgi:thiamine biosynthesis lipoprotein
MRRAAITSDRPRRRWRPARPLALALLLAACGASPQTRTEQLHVFGSIAELQLRDAEPAAAQAALAEVSAELGQLHREWHAWETSDLTRINAAFAAGRPIQAPASVLALIERSLPLAEASGGLFDPAVGGLVAAWGFHTSVFPVVTPAPSPERLDAWRAAQPRLQDVRVDGDILSTDNRAVQLDFGAVAEGMAAELVVAVLRRHGIRQALVNLGGDVVAIGDGGGEPWRVGLRDPFGGVLGGIDLRDGEALFSTGNYNKFRTSPSGSRWGHILDPRTGYPARGAAAVVVLHSDPVRADAAATALFVAGPAGFEAIARSMALGCALMITDENELLVTRALATRVDLERDPVALGPPIDLGDDCR